MGLVAWEEVASLGPQGPDEGVMAELKDEAGEVGVQGEGKLKIERGLGFREAMLGRAALAGPLSNLGEDSRPPGQAVAAACRRRGSWPLG